jgi:hypothetical protein
MSTEPYPEGTFEIGPAGDIRISVNGVPAEGREFNDNSRRTCMSDITNLRMRDFEWMVGGSGLLTWIYAAATTPEMTGLKGAFAAAMTGMGTAMEAALFGAAGFCFGAISGEIMGDSSEKRRRLADRGALAGFVVAGLLGLSTSYHHAKDIVVNGLKNTPTQSYNGVAREPMAMPPAPQSLSGNRIAAGVSSTPLLQR